MKTLLVIAPQLVAIFVSTVLISVVAIYYQRALKKIKSGGVPRGLLLIIERMVVAAENFVVEMLGARYKCLTIYFLYLILYLSINNLLDLFGIESATTSFTVVLSLGVVCFIGIYYFGIKFHKLHFFKKYLINPPEIFGQFVPLISISFRLFGNLLGGSLLIALVMQFTHFLWGKIPIFGQFNLLGAIVLPFFNIYFDIFDGLVQAYIFSLLTFAYWSVEIGEQKDVIEDSRYSTKITTRTPPVLPDDVKAKLTSLIN